mmetsp:Transcript_41702/g.120457  ORF Transcript_41702/g.120457 Transcript_41702/m.120457 type:complete len:1122 (+) Transcript_41702:155-3520(+)
MPNLTPEERLKVVGDYKHGSIRRVKLRNFLTYFDAEVRPGPRLNMVVGPNGTGKSTILCAMCLGLGGEPRLLGRASEIETFVANGEDEGEIEIELENSQGPNPIIRREIRRHDSPKSVFYWNNEHTTAKKVKERCLKEYDITVDNLCTFLPQDKVGGFSGFDSKQLLIETEKALGKSQKHYHTHMQLIEQEEDMRSGDNQRDTLEDRLKHLEQEGKRLERAKDLMEKRDVAVAQLALLKKKLLWLQIDDLVDEAKLKKREYKEYQKKCKELDAASKPLQQEYNEAKANLQSVSAGSKKYEDSIRSHQAEMDKQAKKYQNHQDKIERAQVELEMIDTNRQSLQAKVEEMRRKLEEYQAQIEQSPSLTALREEELQCRQEYKALIPDHDSAKQEYQRLIHEYREIEDEFKRAQTKVDKQQDEKARRRERIFRQNPNLKEISDWVQSNRRRFRKEVVGPVMCEITTKDTKVAAYLEQHVPNAALKSFVVQCKEDYDLLYKCIRQEKRIPINIVIIDRIKPVARLYSEEKMAILKRDHGVLGYLDEGFDAPPLVVEALKKQGQIQKVLIGGEKTQDSIDNRGLLDFLAQPEGGKTDLQSSCIFSCKGERAVKYTSVISKYSKKASTRIDSVRPAKWLAPGVSEEEKERVKKEYDEISARREEALPAMESAKQAAVAAEQQVKDAMNKMKKAKENFMIIKRMEGKKETQEAKLRDAERQLEESDDVEKNRLTTEINNRVDTSIQALQKHAKSYQEMMKATVKYTGLRLNIESAKVGEQRLRAQLDGVKDELAEAERMFKDAKAEYNRMAEEVNRLHEEANAVAPLMDADKNELPLKAELDALPVATVDECMVAMEESAQEVDSIEADHNAIREYERNKEAIEVVRTQLSDLNESEERKKNELDMLRQPWEEALERAVAKVDSLFGKYMTEMGCMGEVRLTKGDSFKDWGIEIRVSFRGNTNLQVLSARVQSGGERSVSTIMYLMALQDMMVSPFRCVDEINQGLDERNERLVFKRIVTNSTHIPGKDGPTDHSGQYFLITPKLLPNLYDMEVEAMTVLFIFNGPFNVKDPRDFNIAKLLALRKRRRIQTEAADDEENTPNSQAGVGSPRPAKQARRSLSSRSVQEA